MKIVILILGLLAAVLVVATGTARSSSSSAFEPPAATCDVRVYDASGRLVGPVRQPVVRLTDEQWQRRLNDDQFRILREAGTERAGTGALLDNKKEGVYTCAGCDLPLFLSDSKFESGTGWPSFFRPIAKENVGERADRAYGMVRTEILCNRCEGHLGHVFNDGPQPTGLRYCLNSASLDFTPATKFASLADPDAMSLDMNASTADRATIVVAGGCFWCVEAVFEELDGVDDAISGYAGGTKASANYKEVCSGQTDHAEAVKIIYDPAKISYADLLRVHFATHDPTQLNRQGNDVGRQYRSAIFFANEQEKAIAKAFVADINEQGIFERPVATTLEPLTEFYEAEAYHQNYVCTNPEQGYVRAIALPKVEKVRKQFKDRLKKPSPTP